jgi:hypothetical protein
MMMTMKNKSKSYTTRATNRGSCTNTRHQSVLELG